MKPDPVVCVPESALADPAVSTGDDPGVPLTVKLSKVQSSNTVALVADAKPDKSCAEVVSLCTRNPAKTVRITKSQNSCFFINYLLNQPQSALQDRMSIVGTQVYFYQYGEQKASVTAPGQGQASVPTRFPNIYDEFSRLRQPKEKDSRGVSLSSTSFSHCCRLP